MSNLMEHELCVFRYYPSGDRCTFRRGEHKGLDHPFAEFDVDRYNQAKAESSDALDRIRMFPATELAQTSRSGAEYYADAEEDCAKLEGEMVSLLQQTVFQQAVMELAVTYIEDFRATRTVWSAQFDELLERVVKILNISIKGARHDSCIKNPFIGPDSDIPNF